VFGPWMKTESFANAGYGFHGNDARGVTISVDPASGDPADRATPLVRSKGAELGLRTELIPDGQSSLSLWWLTLDSELVFVGDAGSTEAGRPSRRYGSEFSTRWRALPWMLVDLDLDLAWSHAGFSEDAPEGNYVPGAPDWVVAAGVSVPRYGPWSGAVFLRYIGSHPLTEDNRVRSDAQTVFDAQVGYELARGLQLRLDVFKLFNAETNDISYDYTSRLPGEPPQGVDDRHVHPGEPRSYPVSLSHRF
jgi:outer membrane receptor protein involved in Fe transport